MTALHTHLLSFPFPLSVTHSLTLPPSRVLNSFLVIHHLSVLFPSITATFPYSSMFSLLISLTARHLPYFSIFQFLLKLRMLKTALKNGCKQVNGFRYFDNRAEPRSRHVREEAIQYRPIPTYGRCPI